MPKPGPYYVINYGRERYGIGDPATNEQVLSVGPKDIAFAYRVADALNAFEGRGPTTPAKEEAEQ